MDRLDHCASFNDLERRLPINRIAAAAAITIGVRAEAPYA